ncbi:hypothetical protein GBL85_01915 [Streptococcus equi]|nr:hypothetical protein [Streptococcus equi]NBK45056.1 hypothetical protein [Streptococcus equi]NBK49316.1 hypothetical protein [Streptococcus equi]NBK57389.1 hypothetical protein [Streptococcus equi]NBK59352.1 hypothetical protein [Streptococcus equi]
MQIPATTLQRNYYITISEKMQTYYPFSKDCFSINIETAKSFLGQPKVSLNVVKSAFLRPFPKRLCLIGLDFSVIALINCCTAHLL